MGGSQITDLGRAMALFPLSPRFSRMLVSGQQHGCLPYIICIISALSVGDPFIYEDAIARGDGSEVTEDGSATPTPSDAIVVENERRLSLRKAFFESQHVGPTNPDISLFLMVSNRPMLLWEISLVIYSRCYLSLEPTNMLVVGRSFAQSTLCA